MLCKSSGQNHQRLIRYIKMEGCLLCLEISKDLVDSIKVNSAQWQELNIKKLIQKHLWPLDTIQNYLWICRACWRELYDFHKFYQRIEDAHMDFARLIKPEFDCELLTHKDKIDSEAYKSHEKYRDSLETVDYYLEPEILINQPLTENLLVMEEPNHTIKIEPSEELGPDAITLKQTSTRKRFSKDFINDWDLSNEDPLERSTNSKTIKSVKPKYNKKINSENPSSIAETIKRDQATAHTLIKQDPDKINQNMSYYSTDNDDSDTDFNYEPDNDEPESTENKSQKKSFYKYRTRLKENDEFIAENFKEMRCDLCQFPMDNFRVMQKHFAEKHNQKGYVICCTRKFYGRSLLVDHIQCHLNPNHFKCNTCGKVMSDRIRLGRHMKHVHGEGGEHVKQHSCDVCDKSFAEAHKLKSHKLTHLSEEEKKFPCAECGKSYGSAYNLNYHIQLVHLKKFVKICYICGKSISSSSEFKAHMDKHEGKPAPIMSCDICGLRLTSERGVKRHKEAQHPEGGKKDHCCPICPKVSPTLKALKKHINTMHEIRFDHKCTICEKAFKRAEALKEHMASHTGTTLYTCPWCPKTFNSNGNMHSHRKKIHLKEWEDAKLQKYSGNLPKPVKSSVITNDNNKYDES